MSTAISAATGRPYGVERVCHAWNVPRSSYYAFQQQEAFVGPKAPLEKRGPKTAVSDEALLAYIRADIARSLFLGEGHRKIWARLRVLDRVRVGRKRALRIMRENNLLSPHRGRQGKPSLHEGKITTDAPSIMWGTDGARIFTLNDGWVWLFSAIEHWNAECVGWHVCKTGDRFAALQPIAMGLQRIFGSTGEDAARGLSLRMDHGTQYLSDHLLNQIRFWGIAPSFAFVAEPQTNGVAERFNRTLKEQAIFGRIFLDIAEVQVAVREFVTNYNNHWLVEKLGFKSPVQARMEHSPRLAA